jgi:predicted DsbA family dithiol-disulfide isomerase
MTTDVDLFIDPSCPWAWNAARWLRGIAAECDLALHWRSFSTHLRDGGELPAAAPPGMREAIARSRTGGLRALRVFEAAREAYGEKAVDPLYQAWGDRYFPPSGADPAAVLVASIEAAGLPAEIVAAADEEGRDEAVRASMEAAFAVAGNAARTPTMIVRDDPPHGMQGPLLGRVPTGADAVQMWDAVRTLSREQLFYSLERPRPLVPPSS